MSTQPDDLPIDRQHPFVRAVFAAAEGRGSLDAVVELLLAAGRKHGVYVLGAPYSASLSGINDVRIQGKAPSLPEVFALLKKGEDLTPLLEDSPLEREEWCSQVLYPYLEDVPLILTGSDFSNDYGFVTRGPMVAGFGWRAWGAVLADWANLHFPPSHPAKPWIYIDFYMSHGDGTFAGYSAWVETLRAALDAATLRILQDLPDGR